MRKADRRAIDQAQREVLGDEVAAELRARASELAARLGELTAQVHAQFTTISAHAEIARHQAEFAREEARTDLDRTRSLLIDLIEQLRTEMRPRPADGRVYHTPGSAPGPSLAAYAERVAELEGELEGMRAELATCARRQRELADTMAALLDTILVERRGEPVTGLSLV